MIFTAIVSRERPAEVSSAYIATNGGVSHLITNALTAIGIQLKAKGEKMKKIKRAVWIKRIIYFLVFLSVCAFLLFALYYIVGKLSGIERHPVDNAVYTQNYIQPKGGN
jgi:hypothetical protein